MSGRALLYGATGFTGREIARALAGTDLVLAGRDAARLRELGDPLGLEWRAVPLDDPQALTDALEDVDLVLHAAGPFAVTAAPMVEACLRTGAHYLDLNGEWPVFLDLVTRDAEAKAAGVMILPGIGLTIAATDGLLAIAKARWPDTVRFRLGISRGQVVTGGSVSSAARLLSPDVLIRRNGHLVTTPAGALVHAFDFGDGLREAAAMSWADVVTGQLTTGVENIEVYSELGWPMRASYRLSGVAMGLTGVGPWRAAGQVLGALWPGEPSRAAQEKARFVMAVEALDAWRRPRRLRLITYDGYTSSVLTAVGAIRRVLSGTWNAGFQTPSRVFGPEFVVEAGAAAIEEVRSRTEAAA